MAKESRAAGGMTTRPRERRKARREPRGENSVTRQRVGQVTGVVVVVAVSAVDPTTASPSPLSSVMPSSASKFSCFNCLECDRKKRNLKKVAPSDLQID